MVAVLGYLRWRACARRCDCQEGGRFGLTGKGYLQGCGFTCHLPRHHLLYLIQHHRSLQQHQRQQ